VAKIVIDPGHGGADPGAVGPTGLKEKDVALAISKQVADLLRPICTVMMTRTTDIRLGSTQRADLQARVAIAEKEKADRFLSIHCNSFSDRNVRGIETFAYSPGGNGEKLARAIQAELIKATGLNDRKVKFSGSSMYVLKYTSMSAVLTETGFISNPDEEKLLRDPSFQSKAARAIALGVARHLGVQLPEPKPAPAPTPSPAGQLPKVAREIAVKVDGKPVSAKGYLIDGTTYLQGIFIAGLFGGSVTGHGDHIDVKTKK
jgi:N-acetylmuramoyl-L-alanine amidase